MGSRASWRLVRQGEHAPFEVSGDTIVGRSKQSDLCLPEGFVSRRHARLWLEFGRLMVEDLGSANGTFVNGERVIRPISLAPGDCLTFDVFDYFVEAMAPSFEGDPNATGLEGSDAGVDAEIEESSDNDVTGPALFEQQPPPWPREASVTQPMAAVAVEPSLPPLDDSAFDLDVEENDDADFDLERKSAPFSPSSDCGPPAAGQQSPLPPPSPPVDDLASTLPPDLHAPVQPPAPAMAATVDMRSGESGAVSPEQFMGAPAEHAASCGGRTPDPDAPALLATAGPLEGSLIHLEAGRILLGRGVECDIWVDHPAVSRQHLEIFLSGGRCRVRQMDGAEGALLNGNPLGDMELIPGDVLSVGSMEFVYDSFQRLTESQDGLPPWVWMLVGFLGAGAILAGLFMFVL